MIGGSWSASGTSTRTSKVCGAISSPLYVFGDVHGVHSPASSEHSYVGLLALAENSNVALVLSVRGPGRT